MLARILAGMTALIATLFGLAIDFVSDPTPLAQPEVSIVDSSSSSTSSTVASQNRIMTNSIVEPVPTMTTTTTIPGHDAANCPNIWETALDAGWPAEWISKLDRIVWEESRCTPDIVSRTGDYGYTQINWKAHGSRLSSYGVTKEMLLDPATNLSEALWIAEYARDNYGCWAQPWYSSGSWCSR